MDTLLQETSNDLYAVVGDGAALNDAEFATLVELIAADKMTPARRP